MTETTFIDGAVGKIAIHDLGGNAGDTLLIAHATGFLGKVYQAFARELANDVRVIAIDFRGHGDSDAPTNAADFDWHGMADDLARVISHINHDKLHAFGHSMGGAAVCEVERSAPGTFTTAMVFEPIIPPGPFPGGSPLEMAARARRPTFPSIGEALERYAARPPLGLFRADVLSDYVQHGFRKTPTGEIELKCAPDSEATTFSNAGKIRLASLTEIELDISVAMSGDGGLPAQLATEVATHLPNGRLLEFPTITHFGPLQDPVIVAEAMQGLITASRT